MSATPSQTSTPGLVAAIAANSFREAVRDRILYNLVLFVLLIVACAILLGDLTNGQEARTIVNIGLNAILLFGAFIAIFVGVGLVSKEIERRTVHVIFAKPVARGHFIVGKYLGLCATLLVNVAVMGIGVSLALLYVGSSDMALSIWPAIYLIFVELTLITAVATLFSTFSTPALSALFTFFIFLIGHLSSSLNDLGQTLGSAFARVVLSSLYYTLPNLSLFSFRTEAANALTPGADMLATSTLYGLVYAVILLTMATVIFSRRDLK
jgi:ABC-type transport system involved in multi-copper enzyme maturation permease subunit